MNAVSPVETLVTDHLDLWTTALKRKSTAGRGSSSKVELYGIRKLRELILELAVRGLLVPQDPNDEPASELLKRIAAERAKLLKEGRIKKGKPLPSIAGGSKQLPPGWSWTCMAALGEISPRNEAKDDVIASFVPMPLISTRFDGRHDHESTTWAEIKKGYTHFADGDVAIAKITPCFENSKAAIFSGLHNGIGAGTTELHVVRPIGEFVSRSYLLLYLKSPPFLRVGETKMTGSAGQKRVPTEFFSFNPLPLPPLAEQHRIVAKVDELMALCDQLEQQTDATLGAHQTLVETLLSALTSAADHAQFASAWRRIAGHFDTLFTTEESIVQLKQTILQLAVMGKLVPQDPNDEPASELLKKIAAEKAKLVKEGKIKKEKPLPPIGKDERKFALPERWEWVRLANISDIQSGIAKGKKYASRAVIELPYLRVANVQRGFLILDEMKMIEILVSEQEKYAVKPRDLLITEGGDWDKVGRTAIWRDYPGPMLHQNHVFKARLILPAQNELWLEKYLNGPFAREYFAGSSKQTTNLASINKTQLSNTVLPIPPIAEQHRIVAKVDELMALCDQLKSCLNAAQTTQLHLADALVEQAIC